MALSNIFREPRRELTESAVGMMIVGAAVFADYEFSRWLEDFGPCYGRAGGCSLLGEMFVGAFVIFAAVFILLGFLFGTHALGDSICNALQRAGIHLRPRVRK